MSQKVSPILFNNYIYNNSKWFNKKNNKFILNEDLVVATHRVIKIDAEKQHFYTKGLANEIEDSEPVHFNNVIGVPQFSIPKLGYVSDFVQNPPGSYVTIIAGVIVILLVFLPDLFGAKKKKEAEQIDAEVEAAQLEIDNANEENEKLKAELEKLRQEMAEKIKNNENNKL